MQCSISSPFPFSPPPIYAILNLDTLVTPPLSFATSLLSNGISLIQVRSKRATEADLSSLIAELLTLRTDIAPHCRIIVNDYVELASKLKADGVHLGQEDTAVSIARDILGRRAIIGISTHSEAQFERAQREEVDYIAIGPIFPSPTKANSQEPLGVRALKSAKFLSKKPLVAIGGITEQNAAEAFLCGADSIALISALERTEDLEKTLKELSAYTA